MYQESGNTYLWYAGQYNRCSRTNEPSIFELITQPHDQPWIPSSTSIPIDKLAKVRSKVYTGKRSIPKARSSRPPHTVFSVAQLHKVTWELPPARCQEMITNSTSTIPLILVSDGSSIHGKHMSFGAVIGFPTGHKLLEISGPVPGIPTSHRAECYACLAGLQALISLYSSPGHSSKVLPFLNIYSDNKAMISSMQQRRTYSTGYTNTTMSPDWDLLEEINTCINELCAREPKIDWVKGHQDRTAADTSQLPMESQFNIRADAIANQWLLDHPSFNQFQSPILKVTKCQLDIKGKTITGGYKAQIHRSIAERPYHDYLQRRHQWDFLTTADIDWRSLESAASTYFATEIHLSKLIHGLLPTRAHVSKFQPWIPSKCHFCDADPTFHHLQICTHHPMSSRFRIRLYDRLSKFCLDKHLPAAFIDPFMETISMSLQDTTPPAFEGPSDTSDPRIKQLQIGHQLVTRGFLSKKWTECLTMSLHHLEEQHQQASCLQNPYITATLPPLPKRKIEPHLILAGIIKIMWGEMGVLWLDHLDLIHRKADMASSPETFNNLRSHVLLLQDLQPYALPSDHDQYFLDDPVAFCHSATPETLHRYIVEYRPRIINSVRTHLTKQNYTRKQVNEIITSTTTWSSTLVTLPLPPRFHQAGEPPHRKHQRYRHKYPGHSGDCT